MLSLVPGGADVLATPPAVVPAALLALLKCSELVVRCHAAGAIAAVVCGCGPAALSALGQVEGLCLGLVELLGYSLEPLTRSVIKPKKACKGTRLPAILCSTPPHTVAQIPKGIVLWTDIQTTL